MKVIGVGCIWLDYADQRHLNDDPPDGKVIVEDFKDALEKIENISNVCFINARETDYHWQGADVVNLPNDNRVVPIFPHCSISFDIYLPKRVQNQISGGRECDTESFHVDLHYDYYMPVSYVSYELDAGAKDLNPSTGLMIVRKFLEQRLTGNVISGCVGPSPFHADFFVAPKEDHEGLATFERLPGKAIGYDTIAITIGPRKLNVPEIFRGANDVFAAFYYLTVRRSGAYRRQRKVMDLAKELLEPEEKKGFKAIKKIINDGNIIQDLSREITLGRLDNIAIDEFIHEGERLDFLGSGSFLESYFKEFRIIRSTSIWPDIEALIKFTEERRQKAFANISTLAASLLGGVIGAVLASTLTYMLTQPSNSHGYAVGAQSNQDISIEKPKLEEGGFAPGREAEKTLKQK